MASSRPSRRARSRPEAAASTIPIPSPSPTSRMSVLRTTRTIRAGGTATKRRPEGRASRDERRGTRRDAKSRFRRASPRRCGRCGSNETPSRRTPRGVRFLFQPGRLPRRRASLGGTFGACEPRERRRARCSCRVPRPVGVARTRRRVDALGEAFATRPKKSFSLVTREGRRKVIQTTRTGGTRVTKKRLCARTYSCSTTVCLPTLSFPMRDQLVPAAAPETRVAWRRDVCVTAGPGWRVSARAAPARRACPPRCRRA